MKVIKKNNQEIYKYKKHEFGYDTKISIMFFVLSITFLGIGVLISYFSAGEGGTIVAGFGISSIICDISALIYVVKEIYNKNFYPEVRNILVLTVLYLVMWIIMI